MAAALKTTFAPIPIPTSGVERFDVWKELEKFEQEAAVRAVVPAPVSGPEEEQAALFFPGDGRLLPSIRDPIYYGDQSDIFDEEDGSPSTSGLEDEGEDEGDWTQHSPLHKAPLDVAAANLAVAREGSRVENSRVEGGRLENSRVDDQHGHSFAGALLDENPRPLKPNVLPLAYMSGYTNVAVKLSVNLPRNGCLTIPDDLNPFFGAGKVFVRCRSSVLSYLSANAPTPLYSLLSPYSFATQGNSKFHSRTAVSPLFHLLAVADPNATWVHVYEHRHRLQTIDLPSVLLNRFAGQDRLDFVCHSATPLLAWHRSSLTLAVQYNNFLLVFDYDEENAASTINGSSGRGNGLGSGGLGSGFGLGSGSLGLGSGSLGLGSGSLGLGSGGRGGGRPASGGKWQCREVIQSSVALSGVGWLGDCLCSFVQDERSNPPSVLRVWSCAFADRLAEAEALTHNDVTNFLSRPFCHRAAVTILDSYAKSMWKVFEGLNSPSPVFEWNLLLLLQTDQPKKVKSVMSSAYNLGSKRRTAHTGGQSAGGQNAADLATDNFPTTAGEYVDLDANCLSVREIHPEPTGRYLAVSCGIQTDQSSEQLLGNIYGKLHILYHTGELSVETENTKEAQRTQDDPLNTSGSSKFAKKDTGIVRDEALKNLNKHHHPHYGCLRSGLRSLLRRRHRGQQTSGGVQKRLSAEPSALSNLTSSWSSSESELEHVEFSKSPVQVTDVSACELSHPAPLTGCAWLDRGPAFDDVFCPACVTSLDINGRITIWTETSVDHELLFEPLTSYQLDALHHGLPAPPLKPYYKFYEDDRSLPIMYHNDLSTAHGASAHGTSAHGASANVSGNVSGTGVGAGAVPGPGARSGSGLGVEAAAGSGAEWCGTVQDYRAWWRVLLEDAVKDSSFLNSNVACAANMVFLSSHRTGRMGALLDLFLKRFQVQANLMPLAPADNCVFRPCSHPAELAVAAASLGLSRARGVGLPLSEVSLGQPLEGQESIDFLFLLTPDHALVVLALRNVGSQPQSKSGIRLCCAREDLSIPGQHGIASILQADALDPTDLTDDAFYPAPPVPGLSAAGDFKVPHDSLILPPCRLHALASNDTLLTYRIIPQLSFVASDATGRSSHVTAPLSRLPSWNFTV
ncbi:hypothetical protein GNI_183940 [Gregarina niphandrodes]|uniref:Uncharacterized protein n=1 Tax=Gregarina niphandrodes TaxID=110365 RepID=A0A023AWT3_GRENI|nr:hypothetical protein GNI_183940 [Gregarina niphandrodes]EZG43179.1 hypothetical protein GNI_183940 [Gregarina niphandrodes]|eukprot:XP_011133566.1 hypothetical protein GNI_183940 [Gregarina niphandrodes]